MKKVYFLNLAPRQYFTPKRESRKIVIEKSRVEESYKLQLCCGMFGRLKGANETQPTSCCPSTISDTN